MLCGRCGEENPDRARFCLSCGAPLAAAESRQERKLISVLFVDLVGFTGRSDQADPEDVRDTLQAYHRAAQEAIESFGGTLEKFIGDAVMAVFGAPVSHGDDAERAVRAGLAVLEAVTALGMEARAAVNSGEAVIAVDADAAGGEALAMGDVVNTASRLQSAAPSGGLVVGEETFRLTRHALRYEELPAVQAKGKEAPVGAWQAMGVAAPADRPAAPMVGRDRELDLLMSIWQRAANDRRPHVVTVFGPPGIGKSRLQREFSRRVHEAGGRVLRGRCLPYGERAAYGAFGQLVRDASGVYENDPPEVARAKVADSVTRALPPEEAPEITRYLLLLVGLGADEPAMQRDFLFFAARRYLESLSGAQPLLAFFEDLHWADAGLLDLLEYLGTHVRDVPLVILGLARPELLDKRTAWGSSWLAHSRIALEPLSSTESAALAGRLLESVAASGVPAGRLAVTAEGNPLFIEELAAALLEGGQGELPTSIRAAIAARLDALPPNSRAVLLDASVIGRYFWRNGLQALTPDREVDGALSDLEARDLVRRLPTSRVKGDQEYLFKHILTRDVAYATLPRTQRRRRHAAVAAYIEAAAESDDLAALLAHHWREGGEPSKAIEYLERAAQQALNGWALEDMESHYDAALALAEDESTKMRLRLARALGRVMLEDFEDVVRDLEELLPSLSGRERVEALLGLTRATHWTEQTERTLAGAQEALELARHLGDSDLVAPAMARVSQAHAMRGEAGDLDRAIELGVTALQEWPAGRRQAARLEHLYLVGDQYYWAGRLDDVLELTGELSQSAPEPHGVEARLRKASLRATTLAATGRYEEGLALFDQTIAIARELGRPTGTVFNYSTLPLREIFDFDESLRRSEAALEGAAWSGFSMPKANAMADIVQALLPTGELSRAEATWEAQWKDSSESKAWSYWLVRGRLAAARAELELLKGNAPGAADWARRAIEMAETSARLKYQAVGRTLLGKALAAQGDPAGAIAELRQAVALAERLGGPAQRWAAYAALGRALYAAGDDAGAEAAAAEAAGILRGVAAGLSPERSERFLAAEAVRDVLTWGAPAGTA